MIQRPPCSVLLVGLSLALPVHGQEGDPDPPDPFGTLTSGEHFHIAIDPSIDISSGITTTRAGEFTGDLMTDVLTLVGGTPHLAWNAAVSQLVLPLAEGLEDVIDIDVVPGQSSHGLDLILTLSAAGIRSWEYDPTFGFQPTTIESNVALGARDFGVADLNGDERPDLWFLDAVGTRLHILTGGGNGTFEPWKSIKPSTGIAKWIDTVHWTGSSTPEFALMYDERLDVVDLASTRIATFPTLGTSVLAKPVTCKGDAHESLLWITTHPTDSSLQWMSVQKPDGQSWFGTTLGVLGVTGIGVGDGDDDGDSDLWVSHTFSADHVVFAGFADPDDPELPPYDWMNGGALPISTGPYGLDTFLQFADPCIADLDRDKDPDVIVPLQFSAEYYVHFNPHVPELDLRTYPSSNVLLTGVGEPVVYDTLSFTLSEPQLDPAATHIELVTYRRPGGSPHLELVPMDVQFIPLGDREDSEWAYPGDVAIPYIEPSVPNKTHYNIQARIVAIDATGYMFDAWPASVSVYVADDEDYAVLSEDCDEEGQVCSDGLLGGGGLAGGMAPRPNLYCPPPGCPPPPCPGGPWGSGVQPTD